MFPAWAVAHNAHFVPIFFSAGRVNAWAGVLLIDIAAQTCEKYILRASEREWYCDIICIFIIWC